MEIVIALLAAYRLSLFFPLERGPFAVFETIRAWAIRRYGPEHWIPDGLTCVWCQSLYAGLLCAVIVWLGYGWLLLPLALSGGVVLLREVTKWRG